MRLTLRTLLAYRDRVLNNDDHAALHGRIQKSEFASNLLKRIDSVAHQQGIGSPPVIGSGLGSDANSVAEYLDGELPSAQIPEMERICLVSDAQLSELAHCHEILASALSTKIDVPASLHNEAIEVIKPDQAERLRKAATQRTKRRGITTAAVITRTDASHSMSGPHVSAAKVSTTDAVGQDLNVKVPMAASAGASIKPEGLDLESAGLPREVPEYLLGTNRGKWIMPTAILGLCALLFLLISTTLGPWSEISGLFASSAEEPASEETDSASENPLEPSIQPAEGPTKSSPAASPEVAPESENGDGIGTGANPRAPASDRSTDATTAAIVATEGAASNQPADTAIPNTTIDSAAKEDRAQVASWSPQNGEQAEAPVMIRDANGLATLATVDSPIGSGSQLVVSTPIWTTVSLPPSAQYASVQLNVIGPSLASIVDDSSGVAVRLSTGRGILETPLGETAATTIKTEVQEFQIRLAVDARVTVEHSHRRFGLGSVTDADVYQPVTVFLSLEQSATIVFGGQERILLGPGEGVAFVSNDLPRQFSIKQIPDWLRNDSSRSLSYLAAKDLSFILGSQTAQGRSATEAIEMAAHHPRPETRALAAQAALLMGDFAPTIALLNDARSSAHWTETTEFLRESIAIGIVDLQAVAEGLAAQSAKTSAENFAKLLAGPPTTDFPDEAISFLISNLESRSLSARVIAIVSLRELIDLQDAFLPHRPSKEAISEWKRMQTTGRIKLRKAPDPLRERQAQQ